MSRQIADTGEPRPKTRRPAPAAAAPERPRALHLRRERRWLARVLVFVTCVVLVDALFGERGLAQTVRARREYRRAASALSLMKAENAALREQVRRLQEDPATIEAVARKELGLIRPGEILVVVRDIP
jgi:cell division protein FtsB